ncbi:MAG: TRAM domain-containing protein [Nitrospira sp.]|nr:TRAM domain-containing protein [Nitrospira sp.]
MIRSILLRAFIVFAGGSIGYYLFPKVFETGEFNILGVLAGIIISVIALLLESVLRQLPTRTVFFGLVGFGVGILIAGLVNFITGPLFLGDTATLLVWQSATVLILGYLGLIYGSRMADEYLKGHKLPEAADVPAIERNNKILDTSVIIDGRIADLCETGFLEGIFIIPQFILQELQHIADSPDSLKRARGRRGLDILHRIQNMADIRVKIVEEDFPNIKQVDSKIVALAKKVNAKVVTNDLNLNKVAGLQGVTVLNINELSNALKPVVLPGETMRVFVLKEGKESGQGVAYLDDGTMIVVDDARKFIGKNVDVIVTSVLQTTAGRMIFTRLREDSDKAEYPYARG